MGKRYEDFLKLCLGWFIIISTYLLVEFIFILGGLWSFKNIVGLLLLVFPYIVGALYYFIICKGKSRIFYTLGFFIPSITEKIIIYLMGSYIYEINPLYMTSVMQKIINKGTHIRQGLESIQHFYHYIFSFFSWSYVFVGLLLPLILTIFVVRLQKSMDL